MMTTGSGLKNLHRSDTICWGQDRQRGSTNNICDEEEPAYENEQDTQRERERHTHKNGVIFLNSNSYNNNNNNPN